MIDINATLVAQMLNFLILVVVLRLVAYKPIVKMLKEREERIAGSIEKADADMAEAEAVLKDYKAQLASARVKAQDIMDKAEKRAQDEHSAKIQETHSEIKQMKEAAQMVVLSMAAAQKIVSKNMDAAENEALIGEFIDQLDKDKIGDLPC